MKICNVIFYLRQINSPEFKYVISWVVPKAMCLRRCFSQEVSSSDACIAPRTLIFHRDWPFCGAKFPTFLPPEHQEFLVFSQEFPSFDVKFPLFTGFYNFSYIFPSFGPIAPRILVFNRVSLFCCKISYIFPHFWPHYTKNPWIFTGFSLF